MRLALSLSGLSLLALLSACHAPEEQHPPAVPPSVAPPAEQPAPPPVLVPQVVARYPHDATAFTQGLQLLGDTLYESTGLIGQSSVRKVELATGKVRQSRLPTNPAAFGEGLTVLHNAVYQLTYREQSAFTYDAQTLASKEQFSYSGEGWGLTNDGQDLILSNGSATLSWYDPATFTLKRQLTVRDGTTSVTGLNELEYVDGQIYANIFQTNRIARIDAQTGKVTAWIDVTALATEVNVYFKDPNNVPNGIAYFSEHGTLLLTGKRWPTLFEVRLPGLTAASSNKD